VADLKSEKYAEVISLMKKATIGDTVTRRLTQEFKEEAGHIKRGMASPFNIVCSEQCAQW